MLYIGFSRSGVDRRLHRAATLHSRHSPVCGGSLLYSEYSDKVWARTIWPDDTVCSTGHAYCRTCSLNISIVTLLQTNLRVRQPKEQQASRSGAASENIAVRRCDSLTGEYSTVQYRAWRNTPNESLDHPNRKVRCELQSCGDAMRPSELILRPCFEKLSIICRSLLEGDPFFGAQCCSFFGHMP